MAMRLFRFGFHLIFERRPHAGSARRPSGRPRRFVPGLEPLEHRECLSSAASPLPAAAVGTADFRYAPVPALETTAAAQHAGGGVTDRAVISGFNPQPDPPGVPTARVTVGSFSLGERAASVMGWSPDGDVVAFQARAHEASERAGRVMGWSPDGDAVGSMARVHGGSVGLDATATSFPWGVLSPGGSAPGIGR
jgi:hypothetical protein